MNSPENNDLFNILDVTDQVMKQNGVSKNLKRAVFNNTEIEKPTYKKVFILVFDTLFNTQQEEFIEFATKENNFIGPTGRFGDLDVHPLSKEWDLYINYSPLALTRKLKTLLNKFNNNTLYLSFKDF